MKEVIVYQLATALSHFRSTRIVHAPLRLDNVMVANHQQQPIRMKLIDFGLARYVSAAVAGVCVQTMWYRAPEVMLHIPLRPSIYGVWASSCRAGLE